MNGLLHEGSINDLMAPKTDKYAKKKKTLSIIPRSTPQEAMENAAIVRVLGWENKEKPKFVVYKAHYVFDPAITFQNKKKYVTCLGEGCPLCAAGHKANDRYAIMVEHMNSKVKDNTGSERVVAQRKILITGANAIKMLYAKNTTSETSISNMYITATAIIGKPAPTYIFEYKGQFDPNYEVDENELKSFEILKPDEMDAEDAKRLAPLAMGKTQQSQFQAQPYNPGFQAAPVYQNAPAPNYTQPAVQDPWSNTTSNANINPAPTYVGVADPVAAAPQQNLTGNQFFTPTPQPNYAEESKDFNDIPF